MRHHACTILTVLLAYGAACADRPNLVFLTVDTLRVDFLGCYGCPWDISPAIDELAAESLVFDNATCETPLTGPSFSAMFSSRYPRMVGTPRNGMRVSDNVELAAERIRDAGYYTFAVQSNWTLRGRISGLDRGFDVYEESFRQRRWGVIRGERRAEEVARVALEQLERLPGDKPFFGWIHFTDPHAPYRYRRQFSPVEGGLRGLDRTERVRVQYASEVAYTDHHIAKVLEALPENTSIVFVADHGESLYEHDYLGHGRYIYQTCMHVPLMVRAAGVTPGRTNRPVQTLDIAPTLLALLGIEAAPDMLGRSILDTDIPADRPRFMETYGGAVPRIPGLRQLMRDTSPAHRGVIREGWKLIRSANQPPSLYYLPDDPDELRNVHAFHPEVFDELDALLELWEETHPPNEENVVELSGEDLEALQSLGYID